MYLFFDCETTGKAKNFKAPMTDLDNWPRVTQLAWVVYYGEKEICKYSFLIKPDGWVIPKEQFFIENNMSTERCEVEGVPLNEVLTKFIFDAVNCEFLIAHNINFDYNVLGAEMIRNKRTVGKKLEQICTMQKATDFCELPGPYGFKWPTLIELHDKLFNEKFEGAHDALNDVLTCAKCFFEMNRLKLITV